MLRRHFILAIAGLALFDRQTSTARPVAENERAGGTELQARLPPGTRGQIEPRQTARSPGPHETSGQTVSSRKCSAILERAQLEEIEACLSP